MRRKFFRIFILTLLLSPLACGFTLSYYFYDVLSSVQAGCGAHHAFTPAAFTLDGFDTTPYLVPNYAEVRFSSRQTPLEIAAFWIPAPQPQTRQTVIIVHGHAACRRSPWSLLPAGMLHHAGYNVLVLDLRDVGDSAIEDGRTAFGTEEYLDVLGAWDWLQQQQGIPSQQIGLFGYSLGGSTVINAAGVEPNIRAVWSDSAPAHIDDIIDHATRHNTWLRFFRPSGMFVGWLVSGDNLYALTPLEQVSKLGTRPLYLVHGTNDEMVPYAQVERLHAAALANDTPVQLWTTASDHVGTMFDQPIEYQSRLAQFFSTSIARNP